MARALKVVLVLTQVVLMLLGLLMVALGIWTYLSDVEVINLANIDSDGTYNSNFRSPGFLEVMGWLSIGIGIVTFFLAILALVGVGKESKWMLSLYTGLLVLVLLMGGAVIGLGVVQRDKLKSDLRKALRDGIVDQYDGILETTFTFSMAFDQAQVQFDCCGIDNYTDFALNSTKWNYRGLEQVPRTCCKLDEYQYSYERQFVFEAGSSCAENATSANSNIGKQCYEDIEDSLLTKTLVLIAITCVMAIAQILGIISTCCLMRSIKDNEAVDYKTYDYTY